MSEPSIKLEKEYVRAGHVFGESLAGIGIFRELASDVVVMLSHRCRWRRYGPAQTILHSEDESRDIYFVVRGRVCAVYYSASGREVRFNDLLAGELFGEFAAIDGKPRATGIVSMTDTLVASMSADLFWDVLRQHEAVWAATLRRLTGIARDAVQRVIEFSTLPVRSRIHAELLRLAHIAAAGSQNATAVVDPAPTHAEMASRISTHREAVSRELSTLARAKLIEKRGTALTILDIGALVNMIVDAQQESYWGAPKSGACVSGQRSYSRASAVPPGALKQHRAWPASNDNA